MDRSKLNFPIIIFLFLLFSTSLIHAKSPENKKQTTNIGIGVIYINYTTNGQEDSLIKLFRSPKDTTTIFCFTPLQVDVSEISFDDSLGIDPLEFMPTPGRIIFRCIDSTKDAWKIVMNEKAGTISWVKKNANIDFDGWLAYLQNCDYITVADTLRQSPDIDAPAIRNESGCYSYMILSMKGDWIEVETSGYCDLYNDNAVVPMIKGWVKWREGDKIIVGRTYNE